MKKIIWILLLNAFTFAAFAGTPNQIKFSHDGRLYDGVLTEVILDKLAETNIYSASLRTAYYSRRGQHEIDYTTTIASTLVCTFIETPNELVGLNCVIDNRPSDGALVELTMQKSITGTYSATLHQNSYSRMEHKEIDTIETLGSNLEIIIPDNKTAL
jgi:hypothetical protein